MGILNDLCMLDTEIKKTSPILERDLLTIGQWLESKILVFKYNSSGIVSDDDYLQLGDKFCAYICNKLASYTYGNENSTRKIMKNLCTYKLTPYAIDFMYRDKVYSGIKKGHQEILYLLSKSMCRVTIHTNRDLKRVPMYISDYFDMPGSKPYVIELCSLESIEPGAGKVLIESTVKVLKGLPVVLEVGYLHYGDYVKDTREQMDARVSKLVQFYTSLGFTDVNDTIGSYEEGKVMLLK